MIHGTINGESTEKEGKNSLTFVGDSPATIRSNSLTVVFTGSGSDRRLGTASLLFCPARGWRHTLYSPNSQAAD